MVPWWPIQLLASLLFQAKVIVPLNRLHKRTIISAWVTTKRTAQTEPSLFLKIFCLNQKGWLSHFVVQRRGFHLLASLLFQAKVTVPRHSLHNTHNYISLCNNKTDHKNRTLPFLKMFLFELKGVICLTWCTNGGDSLGLERVSGSWIFFNRAIGNRRPPPREKLKSSNRGAWSGPGEHHLGKSSNLTHFWLFGLLRIKMYQPTKQKQI